MRKMYHVSIVDTDSVQNVHNVENTGTDDGIHSAIFPLYLMYNVYFCTMISLY